MSRKSDKRQNQGLLGGFFNRRRSKGVGMGCSCGKPDQKRPQREGCCNMQIVEIEEKKD